MRPIISAVREARDEVAEHETLYGVEHSGLQRGINLLFRRSMRLRYEQTLAACAPFAGRTVLDVGCGPGHYALALAKGGASVVGVDFAEGMIGLCRERAAAAGVGDRCHFFVSDFLAFEAVRNFDSVVIMGVMDHIAEPKPFLSHALAMTRQRALISFPIAGGLLALQRKLRHRRHFELHFYEEQQVRELLGSLGVRRFSVQRLARDWFVTIEVE